MNKIYRLIWSEVNRTWVAVSEISMGRGKRASGVVGGISGENAAAIQRRTCGVESTSARKWSILAFAIASIGTAYAAPAPTQLPTGGQLVAGQASIAQNGAVMNINQSTNRAALNWRTFNLGSAAQVNFNQPSSSSVTLNTVLDSNPSQIFGRITAPGQVFLTNPNGMYFAPSASVDVGGLVATTHTLITSDFMAGNYNFNRNGATGSITNDGNLTASLGGYIALLAPQVRNNGVIIAQMGTVALAAGEGYSLQFDSNNTLANVIVTPATIQTLVENGNAVQAPGGLIILSAQAANTLQGSIINNTGAIKAGGISTQGGVIRLEAGNGQATVSGTLDASSTTGTGGQIIVTGQQVTLADGANIATTGATGGGTINIGGGWQGGGGIAQATTVNVFQTATLNASATNTGNGGTISVWSDITNPNSTTNVYGTLLAQGGVNGGNGGNIETSGHQVDISGVTVNAGAQRGAGGTWLIDPYNYTIDANAATAIVSGLNNGSTVTVDTSSNTATNASVNGSGSSSDMGDITVTAPITKNAGADATLILKATRNIVLQSGATFGSSSNKLNLQFWADSGSIGTGIIADASPTIGTNGGWIKFGNNASITINSASTLVGGDVFFNGTSAQTISTAGGAFDLYGQTIIANTSGLTLNTSGGHVNLWGQLDSGNQYTFVSQTSSGSWNAAESAAKNGTAGGSALGDSYLVTITSRLENSLAGIAANYVGAWIGAYRPDTNSLAWKWVDGPEAGKTFFTQNSASNNISTATNGTTATGYYSNFSNGEPNGCLSSVSGCTPESVGQFFGSAGQWNDLRASTTYSSSMSDVHNVIGYVRETNLATSPLTINAGAGAVTISGSVGGSKALASLTVTAGSMTVNGSSLNTTGAQTYNTPLTVTSLGDLQVAATALSTTTGNITLQAEGSPGGTLGDITVNSSITKTSGNTDVMLKMQAADTININQPVNNTGGTGKLNVTLLADTDVSNAHDGAGVIVLSNSISTGGGNIKFGNGDTLSINSANTLVGGDVFFNGTSAQSLMTGGGNLDIYGQTIIANTSGLTLNTSGGYINLAGQVDSGDSYAFVDMTASAGSGSWDAARTAAIGSTGGGSAVGDSYLVNITSRLENSMVGITANYRGVWIGAYRPNLNSDAWAWANGPEAGKTFFNQNATQVTTTANGSVVTGYYQNFANGEPNGGLGSGNEGYGQITGVGGKWNDLVTSTAYKATQTDQFAVLGYIKETNLAASPLTINAGAGAVTISGSVGGSKALASLTVTAASTAVNGIALNTTGLQTYNNPLTVTSPGDLQVTATTLSVAGPISLSGGNISVSGNITTTATGDINIISSSNSNLGVQDTGTINKTGGGDSTLTVRSNGRVNVAGAITDTSSSGKLNVVLWSNFGANNILGVYGVPAITTEGGNVWIGGSSTASGSTTWNGLTVGNGAAFGSTSGNYSALGLLGAINTTNGTSGGDVYVWAATPQSNSYSLDATSSTSINAGSGNITLRGYNFNFSNAVNITTTGAFKLWSGSGTLTTDTGSFSAATNLNLFKFNATPGSFTWGGNANTQNVTLDPTNNPTLIVAGPITIYGKDIALNNSLVSTGSGSAILISAAGNISTANSSKPISTTNGNITLIGDSALSGTAGVGLLDLDYLTLSAGTGNILLSGQTFSWNVSATQSPTITSTSGAFTFQPTDPSFGQSIDTAWFNFPSTLSGLTIGKSTNTQDVYMGTNALSVVGPISVYGGNIYVNQNLTSTASASKILLKGTGNVIANGNLTTNGGNITLWSDSDASGAGGIQITDSHTLDSRTSTDRTANRTSTASGGGDITLGGGLDDGGTGSGTSSLISGLVASDGKPDGYAVNLGVNTYQRGIIFGTDTLAGHNSGISVLSGGGNIAVQGETTTALGNNGFAIQAYQGLTMNAGTSGNITLVGNSALTSTSYIAVGFDLAAWRNTGYTASSTFTTANGNILLVGRASGGGQNLAIAADGVSSNLEIFAATGTGSVTFDGLASGLVPTDIRLVDVDMLAASGNISLLGKGTGGVNISNWSASNYGLDVGALASSLVTSSTSNFLIQSDVVTNTGITNVNTIGTVKVQPNTTTFTVFSNSGMSLKRLRSG